MSSIHNGIVAELKDKVAVAENALLGGTFKDFTEAKVLVERRKAYLGAIDIVMNDSKNEGNDDG